MKPRPPIFSEAWARIDELRRAADKDKRPLRIQLGYATKFNYHPPGCKCGCGKPGGEHER